MLAVFGENSDTGTLVMGTIDYMHSELKFNKQELDELLSDTALRETSKKSGIYISGKRTIIHGSATGEILLR